jgi:hypothetical protein
LIDNKVFEQELTRLIQNHIRGINTPEGQAIFQRELIDLIQRHVTFPNEEGRNGFERELARFIQTNAPAVNQEARASLERELTQLIRNKTEFLNHTETQNVLTTLTRLRNELTGLGTVSKDIEQLLDRIRWMQFENVQPQSVPIKEQWLTFELPLGAAGVTPNQQQQPTVQIRVSYQGGGRKRVIDPNNTNVTMHFELGINDEFIDVNLAVVERKIGAQVTVSDGQLQPIAEDELNALEVGLEEIGYFLQTAHFEVSRKSPLQVSDSEARQEYVPDYVGKVNLTA